MPVEIFYDLSPVERMYRTLGLLVQFYFLSSPLVCRVCVYESDAGGGGNIYIYTPTHEVDSHYTLYTHTTPYNPG